MMGVTGYARENSSLLVFFMRLLDAGLIFASGAFCFYLLEPIKNFPDYTDLMPRAYLTAQCVAILLSAWWFPAFNVYRSWRGASLFAEIRPLAYGWLASIVGLVVFIFFTKSADDFSRHWLGLWFLSAFASDERGAPAAPTGVASGAPAWSQSAPYCTGWRCGQKLGNCPSNRRGSLVGTCP